MSLKAHYVFATTASFSHVPPIINLCLALLTETPDLIISVILHVNNVDNSNNLASLQPTSVSDRLRLHSVGEKTSMKDATGTYMTMVYKSGEAYGAILGGAMQDESIPTPNVFIFDITSFFYPQVKDAVEANFAGLTKPKLVAYNPEAASEMIYNIGAEETSGSLRWVYDALEKHTPEAVQVTPEDMTVIITHAHGGPAPSAEVKEKIGKAVVAYREVVTENDRVIKIAGHQPFHLYERWATKTDWNAAVDLGWFTFLFGIQAAAKQQEAFISCFPSSVFEPEALEAAQKDPILSKGGYTEMGWFEVKPKEDMGEGIKTFLDKHPEKSVVYVSFGTIVDAGEGLTVLLEYLATHNLPFIYACGGQEDHLPADIKALLDKAESSGQAVVPSWCDQIGVLNHPSTMCFVSHCGVNSTIEGILAGVPILGCGRRWDQILLSAQVQKHGLGIELIQQRSGFGVGKEIFHRPGEICTATPEAMQKEIEDAFTRVKGSEGKTMRANAKKMASEIRAQREGVWKGAVKDFGKRYR